MNDEGAGFAGDTNKVTIYSTRQLPYKSQLQSKDAIAKEILTYIVGI